MGGNKAPAGAVVAWEQFSSFWAAVSRRDRLKIPLKAGIFTENWILVKMSIQSKVLLLAVNCKFQGRRNVLKVSFCLCCQCTYEWLVWVPLPALLIRFQRGLSGF